MFNGEPAEQRERKNPHERDASSVLLEQTPCRHSGIREVLDRAGERLRLPLQYRMKQLFLAPEMAIYQRVVDPCVLRDRARRDRCRTALGKEVASCVEDAHHDLIAAKRAPLVRSSLRP